MSATGRGSAGAVRDGRPRDRDLPGPSVPPRELVFEAFTEGAAPVRGGGDRRGSPPPRGRSSSASAGEWDFVMHGPDGTDYQEWISWTEIAPGRRRIALLHR